MRVGRLFGGGGEVVWVLGGGCLGSVGGCLVGVGRLSGESGEAVWRVWGGCPMSVDIRISKKSQQK